MFTRMATLPAILLLVVAMSACSPSSAPRPKATRVPTSSAPATAPPFFPTPPKGKAFTATLVTDVDGLHDRSFNDLAWRGLRDAVKRFGVTAAVSQPRKSAAYTLDLVRAAQHYSSVTFSIGYGMSHALYTAALEFPRARFVAIDARPLTPSGQEVSLPNVENVIFKVQESGYLVGVIAGLMEKERVGRATHNTIGYLGGQSIPAVNQYLAGYVAGAQSVDPSIKIVGDYANSFTDERPGATLAAKQIAEGADILFQVAGGAGLGYLLLAKARGVYGIGVDASQHYLGQFVLTSALKRVASVVRQVVLATEKGHFTGGDHVFGTAQHATGFARPSSLVPASIVKQARKVEQEIASGTIVPPTVIPRH